RHLALLVVHPRARPFRLALCFFFRDPPTPEIYALSLHDALPISGPAPAVRGGRGGQRAVRRRAAGPRVLRAPPADRPGRRVPALDRKSTRLNSSHVKISYAVFCLKKKKKKKQTRNET